MKTDEITFMRVRSDLHLKEASGLTYGLTYGQTLTLCLLLDRYGTAAHVEEWHSVTELCDYAVERFPEQRDTILAMKNHLNDAEDVYEP